MCLDFLDGLYGYFKRADCRRSVERWRSVQGLRFERFLDIFKVLSCHTVLVRFQFLLKLTIAEFVVRI